MTNEVNKNNDYPLENENQRLEEIEDDGSIKDLKEPIKYYDLIVYCNSFKRLFDKNYWYYKYSQTYENLMKKLEEIKDDSFLL